MSDDKQSNRVVCEGGLDTTQNYINLSTNKPGCATRLVNYEVGLAGGYRRINGYQYLNPSFQEVGVGVATGQVLGIIIFDNSVTGNTDIIAARRTGVTSAYKFYLYSATTGWNPISTGLTHNYTSGGSTVTKLRYAVGNDGHRNHLAIVDGVNNAVLYDGSTWAFVNTSHTGATMAQAGGDQVLNAPSLVAFFSSTLFLASDLINNAKGVASYSTPNKFFDFTVASGGGQLVTGVDIIDFKPFRDLLYVFGINSIRKASANTTTGFLMKDVTQNIGCVARDSVVEVGGDLVFLAPDGFRPVSGTDKIGDVQLETLSKPIHKLVQDRVTAVAGTEINSVVIRGKSQFRYFFGNAQFAAVDSRGIIAGLRTADQENGWEFGELLGFRVSCVTSRYILGTEYILHGDYDGKVYRQEMGNDLNGTNMLSVYSTPYLDLGDTEVRKVIEKVTTYLNGEGTIGIDFKVDYDWGRTDVLSPATYTIQVAATVPTYDTGSEYNTGIVYGGILTPVFVTNVEGSFFSSRMTYTTSGSEPPHSIHAIIVEYHLAGRR